MMWRGVPVPTFEEGSDVEAYLERLECFMTMAGTPDNKKVSLLLCGLSSVQYETVRDLVAPETPKDVAFDDLTAKLKRHYGSTRNTRMERAKFRSIMRGENESVMNFEVRLRHGVRYCGYTGATLNDCLVEQFIQGINNKAIAKKLLEKEGTMSLNEAVEIANAVLLIEAGSNGATASASASGVSHSEGPIKGTLARVTTVKCFRCNREGHRASDKDKCRAVTQTCNTCGQKGHFSLRNSVNKQSGHRGVRSNSRQKGENRTVEKELKIR